MEQINADRTVQIFYSARCPNCLRIHNIDNDIEDEQFEELEEGNSVILYCKCGVSFEISRSMHEQ